MHQYGTWMATASNCVTQQFIYDGTNLNAVAPWTPDTRPFTANALDDEADGNVCNVSTLWTWVNQGSATCVENNGQLILSIAAASGVSIHNLQQSVPSAPYTFDTKVCAANLGNGNIVDIGFSDGTKYETVVLQNTGGTNNPIAIGVSKYTNSTTFSSSPYALVAKSECAYVRVLNDNTNIKFLWSPTGAPNSYAQMFSEAKGAFLTTAPTKVIVGVDANNASFAAQVVLDWFRRTQ